MKKIAVILILVLAGCATGAKRSDDGASLSSSGFRSTLRHLATGSVIPPETRQLLLVVGERDSVSAVVAGFERKEGKWVEVLPPMRGVVGRAGFAPPGEKREGDGRSPSGVYPLRRAFGYAPGSPTRLPYRQATEDDLWVDDVNAPDYNRWVRRGETAATSYELMRREDDLYKVGIVIEYNTLPVVSGHGSAIFLHLWKGAGEPTAGCVAMAEEDVLKVLEWLDPTQKPVIAMGAAE